MQQNLFDTAGNTPPQKKGLAIMKQGKQVLTKQQKDFNRLVKRIERLRSDLERFSASLTKHLEYYSTYIHPLEQQLVALRITGVKIFFPYYTGEKKFLSKNEKNVLGEIISTALDEIFYFLPNNTDEELKAIYEAVNGESFDDVKKDAFNEMKDDLEEQFRDAGFDINLGGLDENMTEEEIMRKMKEMQEEFARQAGEMDEKNATRKKTKKQQQQEEREKQIEEVRKKSISSIYKQLAKAFHPDLETDEEIKLQKEVIMKQLTVAYENNDLHTLLKLEMEWIQKETNDPAKLSNDKLAIYNEALKEQVMELEMQIDVLDEHPRYIPLQRFSGSPSQLQTYDLLQEKKKMQETIYAIEDSETDFKGPNAVKYIKEMVHAYQQVNSQENVMEQMLMELMKGMK